MPESLFEHLGATLNALGVATEDIDQVTAIANSVCDDEYKVNVR